MRSDPVTWEPWKALTIAFGAGAMTMAAIVGLLVLVVRVLVGI